MDEIEWLIQSENLCKSHFEVSRLSPIPCFIGSRQTSILPAPAETSESGSYTFSPCWSKTMIRCPADLHGRVSLDAMGIMLSKKESNSSNAERGMVSGKTLTSMALTWPRLWRDVQSRGSEFDLMAMPGWHEGFKEVELWILCVGSRGSTSYWAGCLRHISFTYPSQIRFFECFVLMSWIFISTVQCFLYTFAMGVQDQRMWSFGWSLYRIPPTFLFLDFLVLHILSLTYPSMEALLLVSESTFAPGWSLTYTVAREHFRQPIVDYINPECLVSKCIETRRGSKNSKTPRKHQEGFGEKFLRLSLEVINGIDIMSHMWLYRFWWYREDLRWIDNETCEKHSSIQEA